MRRGGGEGKTPVQVARGLVTAIGEGPAPLTGAPLWLLGGELCAALADLPGPPFELAQAFRGALARSTRIVALDLGPTRDLTSPEDVVLENFPYLWRRR